MGYRLDEIELNDKGGKICRYCTSKSASYTDSNRFRSRVQCIMLQTLFDCCDCKIAYITIIDSWSSGYGRRLVFRWVWD